MVTIEAGDRLRAHGSREYGATVVRVMKHNVLLVTRSERFYVIPLAKVEELFSIEPRSADAPRPVLLRYEQ